MVVSPLTNPEASQSFQDDAPDARAILENRGQEIHVPDDWKATVVFRQFPQSL